MLPVLLPRNSLKTRISITVLILFLAGLWSFSFYAASMLRADMERVLGEQEFATVSQLAAHVNYDLTSRTKALEAVAERAVPYFQQGPGAMRQFIDQRPALQSLFNGGVMAYGPDGTVIADFPVSAGRLGVNYMHRDYMVGALGEGRTTIGKPIIGYKAKRPVFVIATPVRDSGGRIIGAVSGLIDLTQRSFLDQITDAKYGTTGGYVLIAPQHRLVITATDKSRVMEQLPERGVNAGLDRFVDGYEGSSVLNNPKGIEVIASVKAVPAAGWILAAALPTAEAFAPVRDMQKHMWLGTLILTLAAGALIWLLLRRQLAPISDAAAQMTRMTEAGQSLQPLPAGREDELGLLILAFNRLIGAVNVREHELRAGDDALQSILLATQDGFWRVDGEGRLLDVNPAYLHMSGYTREELRGMRIEDLDALHRSSDIAEHMRILQTNGADQFETVHRRKDGTVWQAEASVTLSRLNDGHMFAFFRDITARKNLESERRIAAIAFNAQEGMTITDADRLIVRVNPAFSRITGYFADEVIGKNPSILQSGRHDGAFYKAMWETINATGSWQGEIWNRRKCGEVYPEWLTITAVSNEAGEVVNYVATFTDITFRKESEDKIRHLAFYDPLTKLPNRRLMLDRLGQVLSGCARHHRHGALMMIDLDNFKTLNDTLGHDVGDQLLIEVAARIEACLREGDTVARLGGDEFVVILENLDQTAAAAMQAEVVAVKIQYQLARPYELSVVQPDSKPVTRGHQCTSSLGITLFNDAPITSDEVLKRADTAMYQAKGAGRNTLRFFDPDMQAAVLVRATMELEMRKAIREQGFFLKYQAQVDATGRVIGAEALLRWDHADRGTVMPMEFIPLAEEAGLILPLGHWVLESACRQLVAWAGRPETAALTLSVNVSARQLHQHDFVEQVLSVLQETGANPVQLKLELTESLLVDRVEDAIRKMTLLKQSGVSFSLDDFGTGYSSLSCLKRLPLDQLKIDQSFVRNVMVDANDAAIVRTIVALGQTLGLTVIAEGVETMEQRVFLHESGCLAYQGYLFGRPLTLAEFEASLLRH